MALSSFFYFIYKSTISSFHRLFLFSTKQGMNAVDRANYVHDTADAYYDSPQLRIIQYFFDLDSYI